MDEAVARLLSIGHGWLLGFTPPHGASVPVAGCLRALGMRSPQTARPSLCPSRSRTFSWLAGTGSDPRPA